MSTIFLTILLIVAAILFLDLFLITRKLSRREENSSRLLKSVIFALYDRRKYDEGERLISIENLEEAIRIVSGLKRPQRDTPTEDLEKILGTEHFKSWRKAINSKEIDEFLDEKNKQRTISTPSE